MVVTDGEANTVVVGVPAHTVGEKTSRAAKAALAFEPNGRYDDVSDPLQATIHQLRQQLDVLQRRVTELEGDDQWLAGSAEKWEPK